MRSPDNATEDGLSAPESKAGQLQRACLALLRQHEREGTIPTNVTFLFYELEQRGVIPKAYRDANGNKRARTPRQDTSDATMRLRECGLVPWWWLEDETRDVSTWRYAASVYEYTLSTVSLARIDCWGGELPPLTICEARATRGVLERITSEYLARRSLRLAGNAAVTSSIRLCHCSQATSARCSISATVRSAVRVIRSKPTRGATLKSTQAARSRLTPGSR